MKYLRITCFLTVVISLVLLTPDSRTAAGKSLPGSLFRFSSFLPVPLTERGAETEPSLVPLALTAADFDEDGVPDLISAYRLNGSGAVRLQRGNLAAQFPHSPAVQKQRERGEFSTAPFFPATKFIALPEAPEFIGAGDFDADGHWDLVAAARGSQQLQYLRGDGHGNFQAATRLAVPGGITALAVGEINHADGLTDVFVGIERGEQGQLLIFTGEHGALRARPEILSLPRPTQEIVAGHVDENFSGDVALAAGTAVIVVSGKEANEAAYQMKSEDWGQRLVALAMGDFDGNTRSELAVLTEAGVVQTINHSELFRLPAASNLEATADHSVKLLAAPLAARTGDSLAVLRASTSQVYFHAPAASVNNDGAMLTVAGNPVAALALRLNADALSDLVILSADAAGQARLEVAQTEATTFTVTNTNDAGAGSLRQAILSANAAAGADEIRFALPGAGPHVIVLQSSMPEINGDLTIDATTQPGFAGFPIVEIKAAGVGINNGLIVKGSNSTVRGLILNYLAIAGSQTVGNNVIQGNFIGRNLAVTEPVVTYYGAIGVSASSNNLIGGTTAEARNYIWGNLNIVQGTGNQVQGNYVGVNLTGTGKIEAPYSRIDYGISVNLASNTLIGGTTAGAGNIVANAAFTGISITGYNLATDVRVQGNYVGLSKEGQVPLGNAWHGIQLQGAITQTLVGGTTPTAANIIAYNGRAGVFVDSDVLRTRIIGNSIFDNTGIGIDWRIDGVDANLLNENDLSPERRQNYPVLNVATISGGNLTVTGSLNSHPFSRFTIDFYSSPACDPSGYGEGKLYLGSTTLSIYETYNGRFTATLPMTVPVGQFITATAFRENGTTSEFSQCIQVISGCSGFFPSAPRAYDSFGGSYSVGVGALDNCAWTAVSSADWVKVTLGQNGTGNGALDYLVTPNTSPASRTATITINGQTLTIKQAGNVTSVSAASYDVKRVGMSAIVSAFGVGLATTTAAAQSLPLPTVLGGTTVRIKDEAGFDRDCPIFYVSPTQVNYFIPDLYAGPNCRLTITAADGTVSTGPVSINQTAPALFSANATGTGVVAGQAIRVKADGKQTEEPLARWDAASQQFVAVPLDLGPATDAVFLTIFGTGFAFGGNATVSIAEQRPTVTYVGPQNQYVGLQQINLRLPRSLVGAGEVELVVNINGLALNRVKVNIK